MTTTEVQLSCISTAYHLHLACISSASHLHLGCISHCISPASQVQLSYGDRRAFIKGVRSLIETPVLRMADECERDLTWVDWKGVSYSLREEWAYVSGPAVRLEGCTPGTRDDGKHDGMQPQGFLSSVNAFIRARRRAGHGIFLPEAHAMLTLEEVSRPHLACISPAFPLRLGCVSVAS